MKQFVRHLVKTNLDAITKNSVLNYQGIKGFHKITLIDDADKSLDLFVVEPNNQLINNTQSNYMNGLSLPFKATPTDISIEVVKGNINLWLAQEDRPNPQFLLDKLAKTEIEKHVGMSTIKYVPIGAGAVYSFIQKGTYYTLGSGFGFLSAFFVYGGRWDSSVNNYPYFSNVSSETQQKNIEKNSRTPTTSNILQFLKLVGI